MIAMGPPGYTACETRIPKPIVLWDARQEPRAGEYFEAQWLTAALAAPTDWPAVLLAGRKPAGVDMRPFGMPGCWLLVDPELWMWPGGDPANLVYRDANTGRIFLQWHITPDYSGQHWRFQLLVLVPRDVAPTGIVLSQALDVYVAP